MLLLSNKNMVPQEKTYGSKEVKIPAPRFYMFYNGMSDMEDKVTYRLSELFQRPVDDPSIELVVTCLNVNEGHNKELMETCKALNGYSIFVSKVRKHREEGILQYNASHPTPLNLMADNRDIMKEIVSVAVNKAIDDCIDEDVLRNFFIEYREEVSTVAILEYSAERHLQYEKEDSYNSGIKDTTDLFSWLKSNHREADILKAIDDPDFLARLFEEFSAVQNR